jgi:hypothetical protein
MMRRPRRACPRGSWSRLKKTIRGIELGVRTVLLTVFVRIWTPVENYRLALAGAGISFR